MSIRTKEEGRQLGRQEYREGNKIRDIKKINQIIIVEGWMGTRRQRRLESELSDGEVVLTFTEIENT